MIIVSDTSPIANLILIDQVILLQQVFGEIIIPPAVALEIDQLAAFSVDLSTYQNSKWVKKKEPSNQQKVRELQQEIDEGESEAIVLAIELGADYLLIDERRGTRKATELGLKTVGLIGVLVMAKGKGLIAKVEPLLYQLRTEAGFWISEKLIDRVLRQVNER